MLMHPLSPRVVVLSWAAAGLAWPLVWLLLTVSQGLGVIATGGEWIGVALPWGQHPWALVNQPNVGYAATRAAFWGYWLTPLLGAAILSLAVPLGVSASRSWLAELLVCQFGFAGACLGFGWAPPLGVVDGPAAGLARFWHVGSPTLIGGCALFGALAILPSVLRLTGHLWHVQAGPGRSRRLAALAVHGLLPALTWPIVSFLVGWGPNGRSVVTLGAVLLGAVIGAWFGVPRAPLRPRPEVPPATVALAWTACLVVACALVWSGAPRGGAAKALMWGTERMTSNVRSPMVRVRLLGSDRAPDAPKR
ncbi:MAG: hypothetical protein ACOY3Y_16040 [Acidobacteriota bacterium]